MNASSRRLRILGEGVVCLLKAQSSHLLGQDAVEDGACTVVSTLVLLRLWSQIIATMGAFLGDFAIVSFSVKR